MCAVHNSTRTINPPHVKAILECDVYCELA